MAITAVLVILTLCSCNPDPGPGARNSPGAPGAASGGTMEHARMLVDSGRARESISILKQLGDKTGPEAHAILARAYHQTKRWNLSIKSSEAALAARPNDTDLLYLKADSLRNIEEPRAARKLLEAILKRAPDHWEAKLSLGRILQRMTSADKAIELFESYLQEAPANHYLAKEARLEYGRALRSVRRHQNAADQFAVLLEGEPSNNIYYSELSSTLYRMRLRPQAKLLEDIYRVFSEQAFEEHVEKGLFSSGRDGVAMGQRAWNRRNQKRFLESFAAYEEALALNPADPRIKIYFADLCLKFERHQQALEIIENGIRGPRARAPLSGLFASMGKIHLFAGRDQQAASALKQAIEALRQEGNLGGYNRGQADGLALYNNLAEALINLADYAGAGRILAATRKAGAENSRHLYLAGKLSLQSGKAAVALAYFEKAIRVGDNQKGALIPWKAAALARGGKTAEALSILLNPGMPPADAELLDIVLAALPPKHPDRAKMESLKARSQLAAQHISDLQGKLQGLKLRDAGCARILSELGDTYEKQGNPAALDYYFLASDIDSSKPAVLRRLLKELEEKRHYFTRMRLLRRLKDAAPDDLQALASLSSMYLDLHIRLSEARDMALRCLEAHPDPDSHLLASRASLLQGDRKEARRLLEKGLELAPGNDRLKKALEEAADR